MRKICGILLSVLVLMSLGLSGATAETLTYVTEEQRLADTPSKYGFKGLYTLFSPDTYQKGKFGVGFYWDMTRFCLPGDPRYPQLQEYTLGGAYGITDRLEVGVAAPYRVLTIPEADADVRASTDDALNEVNENGFSNLSLGVRYNLLRGEGFEMTPYVQAFLPTAQDPEAGHGAENTRIHVGLSAGTVLPNLGNTRLYSQVAYQFATEYDQDRRDFTETTPFDPASQPRFERFGSNPLFHEYGNTLFYGAGFAVPLVEDRAELFSEFQFYHSLEDDDYIPLYEDGEPLDVVQDGGMANVGMKFGFGNGLALTAGWGGILYAEEPMYESATWRAFAGMTYNQPEEVVVELVVPDVPAEQGPVGLDEAAPPQQVVIGEKGPCFDCTQELAMVHFEFDKSTLTPEAIETLKRIGKVMRLCDRIQLEVQGHTDWMGTENYNIGLGNRRARAVVYYLVYDEGIDPSRVVLKEKLDRTPPVIAGETYGESVPIASNESDSGRALNRRAQFVKVVEDTRKLGDCD